MRYKSWMCYLTLPVLFNMCLEDNPNSSEKAGIKVNGKPINNLRFADDIFVYKSLEDQQPLID